MTVLVTAASRYGGTAEIAAAIAKTLNDHGLEVTVHSPEEVAALDDYDAVVLGSAVYTGHWLDSAKALVTRCGAGLTTRPVWLFSSGPVGDPSRALVQKMGEDPVDIPEIRAATNARDHRLFAGKLDKRRLTLAQKAALVVFRGMEGDFRNWAEVERWASQIADAIQADREPGPHRGAPSNRMAPGHSARGLIDVHTVKHVPSAADQVAPTS